MASNKSKEPKEKTIQGSIMRWLRKQEYVWCDCYHGSPMSQAGVPDIQVIYDGRVLWLEVKRPSGKVTLIQKAVHDKLRRAGSIVHVVRSLEEAQRAFSDFVLTIARESGGNGKEIGRG